MCLLPFTSRTNLILGSIPLILRLVKKVITNLDSSEASGSDWLPVDFLLFSSMVPGLLYQLHIFWQLCLIELIGLWIDVGLLEWQHLNISNVFSKVWHTSLLHKINFYGIAGWVFRNFKIISLMLGFLKVPFLVLHFTYHTLMTFLMMVSVVLPLMLMILLSTVSMSNHWIYGNNWSWLLKLDTYEAL